MSALLVGSLAAAGVVVDDGGTCLSSELVQLELRSVLGDEEVSRADIRVLMDPATAPWTLSLDVRDGDDLLWSRVLRVNQADCPYLPALVAHAVEQGLAGVPRWALERRRYRLGSDAELRLVGTLPLVPHLGLGGAVGVPMGGRWLWTSDVEAMATGLQAIGPEEGRAQFAGLTASTGFATQWPLGRSAVRLRATVGGGPFVAFGRGLWRDQLRFAPRLGSNSEVAWLFPRTLRVGVRVQVPITRLVVVEELSGDRVVEPPIRLGLLVAIGRSAPSR